MKRLVRRAEVNEVDKMYTDKGFHAQSNGFASYEYYNDNYENCTFSVQTKNGYEQPVRNEQPIQVTIFYGETFDENEELDFNSSSEFLSQFDQLVKKYNKEE